jgi:hypothetical protein
MAGDDMQDNRIVRGVKVMAVIAPAPRLQVDLYRAAAQLPFIEEDQCVCEVWTEAVGPRPSVNDSDRFPTGGSEGFGDFPTVPSRAERNFRNPLSTGHWLQTSNGARSMGGSPASWRSRSRRY